MAHRKVDVDEIIGDEDQFVDEYSYSSFADLEQQTNAKQADVRNLLQRGDAIKGLKRALEQPPYGPAEADGLKLVAMQTVFSCLLAIKTSDIPTALKELGPADIDILMKYLYKGMASPAQFNASVLLQWHEKVVEIGGFGSIIRCMTDRRVV